MGGYVVYIVRCSKGQLYTGITTDVVRRLREHLSGKEPGARYTRLNPPVALEMLWEAKDRATASQLEWRIKQMSRAQKDKLLADPTMAGGEYAPVDAAERDCLWNEATCTE